MSTWHDPLKLPYPANGEQRPVTKESYRVGIIGLSGIAARPRGNAKAPFANEILISHAASIDHAARVEVASYCDLQPTLLEEFSGNWGSRWPDARAYTNYKEMLADADLDIVTVATSDHLHADMTVDAATAGAKAVFVEKPMATSLEDTDRMIQACEENGTVLSVDHTRRWSPMFHQARESIRGGSIGALSTIVAQRGSGRAMLFRNGTHIIDGICFFAESDPVQVWANLESGFEDWDRYKGSGGKDPANDPAATGFVLFSNGVRAVYLGHKDTTDNLKDLHLSGPDGQIFLHIDAQIAHVRTTDPDDSNLHLVRTIQPRQYQVHGLVAAYEELVRLIENPSLVGVSTGYEARKTVQIMVGFLKSHQEGSRMVAIPD